MSHVLIQSTHSLGSLLGMEKGTNRFDAPLKFVNTLCYVFASTNSIVHRSISDFNRQKLHMQL